MRATRAGKPDGDLLGSYGIATAPEPNSSRLTSFKSIRFDSPANNEGGGPDDHRQNRPRLGDLSDRSAVQSRMHTDFTSVYRSSTWCPISRPQPDCR